MNETRRGLRVLIAILFAIVALGLLGGAVKTGLARFDFVRTAARAEGRVSALNAGGSHPQIEFLTETQAKISYPQGGFIFGYRPGDRVHVLYDARDPAKTACIDAFGALWYLPLFFLAGSALFAFGAWSVFSARMAA